MAIAARFPGPSSSRRRRSSFSASPRRRRRTSGRRGSPTSRRSATPTAARRGYFRQGTSCTSRTSSRTCAWYALFDHSERVDDDVPAQAHRSVGDADRAAGPGRCRRRRATTSATTARFHAIGHSALDPDHFSPDARHRGTDGTLYRKGTAVPQRADFNTLDNPFFWSAHPDADGMAAARRRRHPLRRLQPDQRRLPPRPPGDGRRHAGRTKLPLAPNSRGQGINAVLKTTHRQNFLVPPGRPLLSALGTPGMKGR